MEKDKFNQVQKVLESSLQSIDTKYRNMFIEKYLHGESITAISEKYGIPSNRIRQRFLLIRQKLSKSSELRNFYFDNYADSETETFINDFNEIIGLSIKIIAELKGNREYYSKTDWNQIKREIFLSKIIEPNIEQKLALLYRISKSIRLIYFYLDVSGVWIRLDKLNSSLRNVEALFFLYIRELESRKPYISIIDFLKNPPNDAPAFNLRDNSIESKIQIDFKIGEYPLRGTFGGTVKKVRPKTKTNLKDFLKPAEVEKENRIKSQITKYFQGMLPPEEEKTLLAAIASDPELKEKYIAQKIAYDIRQTEFSEQELDLDILHGDMTDLPKPPLMSESAVNPTEDQLSKHFQGMLPPEEEESLLAAIASDLGLKEKYIGQKIAYEIRQAEFKEQEYDLNALHGDMTDLPKPPVMSESAVNPTEDQLTKYFQGMLPPEEEKSLLAAIASDAALKEKYIAQKIAYDIRQAEFKEQEFDLDILYGDMTDLPEPPVMSESVANPIEDQLSKHFQGMLLPEEEETLLAAIASDAALKEKYIGQKIAYEIRQAEFKEQEYDLNALHGDMTDLPKPPVIGEEKKNPLSYSSLEYLDNEEGGVDLGNAGLVTSFFRFPKSTISRRFLQVAACLLLCFSINYISIKINEVQKTNPLTDISHEASPSEEEKNSLLAESEKQKSLNEYNNGENNNFKPDNLDSEIERPAPQAGFDIVDPILCTSTPIKFTNRSLGIDSAIGWFGFDGNDSTKHFELSHSFEPTITLNNSNLCGVNDSIEELIEVVPSISKIEILSNFQQQGKLSLAIQEFDTKGIVAKNGLGNKLARMLSAALRETGEFDVLSDSDKKSGDSDLIIIGKVTKFKMNNSSIIERAELAFEVEIINLKTGEVLWSQPFVQEQKTGKNNILRSIEPSFRSRAMELAVDKSVQEAAALILEQKGVLDLKKVFEDSLLLSYSKLKVGGSQDGAFIPTAVDFIKTNDTLPADSFDIPTTKLDVGNNSKCSIPLRDRPVIAVLGIENSTRERVGEELNLILEQSLASTECFQLIERKHIEDILKEQNRDLTGRLDNETAAEIGLLLGAQVVVFGTVTKYEEQENKRDFRGKALINKLAKKLNTSTNTTIQEYRAQVGIHFKVVDVTTGRIIKSKQIDKKKTKIGSDINVLYNEPKLFKSEAMEYALTDLMEDVISLMAKEREKISKIIPPDLNLSIDGVSFLELQDMKKYLEGIKGVNECASTFRSSTGHLSIKHTCDLDLIINALLSSSCPFPLKVTKLTKKSISVKKK